LASWSGRSPYHSAWIRLCICWNRQVTGNQYRRKNRFKYLKRLWSVRHLHTQQLGTMHCWCLLIYALWNIAYEIFQRVLNVYRMHSKRKLSLQRANKKITLENLIGLNSPKNQLLLLLLCYAKYTINRKDRQQQNTKISGGKTMNTNMTKTIFS